MADWEISIHYECCDGTKYFTLNILDVFFSPFYVDDLLAYPLRSHPGDCEVISWPSTVINIQFCQRQTLKDDHTEQDVTPRGL